MNVLISSTDSTDFRKTEESIVNLINGLGHNAITWDPKIIDPKLTALENLSKVHNQADILVAFFNRKSFGVFVEIGHAIAKKIPVILICTMDDLNEFAPEHLSNRNIIYDSKRIEETLIAPLGKLLSVENVEEFTAKVKISKKLNVFVSYSHADTEFLERLKIHVKPLEKKGLIDFWSDTKIKTGAKWRDSITKALDNAAIAVLLISADFLASDFIVDNELPPLLKKAEENGLKIIPVILKPCRFSKDDNLSVFQAINNPSTPLSKMSDSDREEFYVKIVDSIDTILNLS